MSKFDKLFKIVPAPIHGEARAHTITWEAQTFQEVVEQFDQPLYRYFAVHTGGQLDHARKMTLETFSIVYRKSAMIAQSDLPSWMFEIAWDVLNVHYSSLDSTHRLNDSALLGSVSAPCARVITALRSLAFYPREALYLRIFAGLRLQDIAIMMDKTEAAISTLLYQGISELASLLSGRKPVAVSRKQLLVLAQEYHLYLNGLLAGFSAPYGGAAAVGDITQQLLALREAVTLTPESRAYLMYQVAQVLRAGSATRL